MNEMAWYKNRAGQCKHQLAQNLRNVKPTYTISYLLVWLHGMRNSLIGSMFGFSWWVRGWQLHTRLRLVNGRRG